MILVKDDNFDIAFKRSEFNSEMDRLRLILYVNNKNNINYKCTIEYDYDRGDFDLNIKKRLINVEENNQGRE